MKIHKLALAMALALAAERAAALGLGEIELHSALNEPLNAEVRLLSEQAGEISNAVVRLAPNDEFVRAGIERQGVLSDLAFTITRQKDGTAVVKITSAQPIREPFLDFIIQLSWQSGKLLREYTLLLDPPVFGEEKAAPVAAPAVEQVAVTPTPTSAESTTEPSAVAVPSAKTTPSQPQPAVTAVTKPAKVSTTGSNAYGPTKRTDTLWNIASNLLPDDSVSVYQMMMALLKENPEAFYDHNVNNLKAGYVLRVPDKASIVSIDHKTAVREAARQYQSWQQSKHAVAGESDTQAQEPEAGSTATTTAAGEGQDAARLRLVAPSDAATTVAGAQAELEKLRGELAIALESSDASKREGEELRSRVASLEQQIDSLQRLLTLKDEALSDMQKRSGLEVPESAKTPAPAAESAPGTEEKPAPAKPAKAKPAKPASKAVEEPAPDLFADPKLLAAAVGAGVLLLAVLWLVIRRKRNSSTVEAEEDINGTVEEAPAINIQLDQAESVAQIPEEEVVDERMTEVAEQVAQDVAPEVAQTANDLEVMPTSEGEIDPIVEADVYLAYRRYQQAEALVRGALEKQPGRHDLQAKLLEIFYAAKNSDAFQREAMSLFKDLGANDDDPLWQRILPMGQELCPEHELFKSTAASDSSSEMPVKDGLSEDMAEAGQGADLGASLDLNIGGGDDIGAVETAAVLNQEKRAQSSEDSMGGDGSGSARASAPASQSTASAGKEEKPKANWEVESAVSDFGNIDFGLDDTDLLAGTDVVGTKLDLARAYIDMGDNESARDILKEVLNEGNEQQKQEANTLMEKAG